MLTHLAGGTPLKKAARGTAEGYRGSVWPVTDAHLVLTPARPALASRQLTPD